MLNEHSKAVAEYLQQLRDQQRSILLNASKAGSDWQHNLPIMDAINRAKVEEEQAEGGDEEAAQDDILPASSIDVSINGIQDNFELYKPPRSVANPMKAVRPAKLQPPSSRTPPTIEIKQQPPKLEERNPPDPPPPDAEISDMLSLKDSIAQSQEKHASAVPANQPERDKKIERRESKRKAMLANQERAGRTNWIHSIQDEQEPQERTIDPPKPASMPHIFGGARFVKFENKEVPLRETDGGIEPVDIAEQAAFASDVAETSFIMMTQTLERLVSAMVKVQSDINVINEVLDRTFGH